MKNVMRIAALTLSLITTQAFAAATFNGVETTGAPLTVSPSGQSVTILPYPAGTYGASAITSATFKPSGKWYAAVRLMLGPDGQSFSFGMGWANQAFDPSTITSFSQTGIGNVASWYGIVNPGSTVSSANGIGVVGFDKTNKPLSAVLSPVAPASGDVVILYMDRDKNTWGLVTPDGINHPGLQKVAGRLPDGPLTIYATGATTLPSGILVMSLLPSSELKCSRGHVPGGYTNIAD